MIKVPFNLPTTLGTEFKNISHCLSNKQLSGNGYYSNLCSQEIKNILGVDSRIFMTPSCTQSLEASSLILDLFAGDEVIMPSFTFVTTATAFAIRGIKIKFVDIRHDTLNIDEDKIESAITEKTRAIIPVHYAGVSCEMDKIMKIAKKHNLHVIEDAAQAMMAFYNGRHLGSIGDISTFSFHDTKNIHCGEGGSLVVNNSKFFNSSQIVTDKGTNRREFLDGNCEKYSWVGLGSSYSMGELMSAFLLDQLINIKNITDDRLASWNRYFQNLEGMSDILTLPEIPDHCEHNAHIFHIRLRDYEERKRMMVVSSLHGIRSIGQFILILFCMIQGEREK